MTEAEAIERLGRLVAKDTAPTLTDAELADLLGLGAIADSAEHAPEADSAEWVAGTAYAVGDTVVPTSRTGRRYIVTIAGTSDASEPSWPASGAIADGGVTWELDAALPAAWLPTYDLAIAAAEGWRYKAGRTSDRFRFSQEGEGYDRNQVFEHCLRMAEIYEAKRGTLLVGDAGTRGSSAFELAMDRSDTVVGLDDERLIQLNRWTGSGAIPRVN